MEFIKQQTTETIEINSKFPEKKLNAEWMSYDKNVHKVVVPIRTQSVIAFQMDEVEKVLVFLKFSKGSFGPFEGKVEDEEQRTVSFEVPDEVRGQTGTVNISVMLNLSGGRQVDLAKFTATARLSAVDSEAPEMQKYYLPMYEDLVADIEAQKEKFEAASIYNKAEVDSKEQEITAQLAHKVGGTVKAKPEDLSAETLGLVTGAGGPINLMSIPQDYSVTPEKTTFIQLSEKRDRFLGKRINLNTYINPENGVENYHETFAVSEFIAVEPLTSYIFWWDDTKTIAGVHSKVYYDENKVFISGEYGGNPMTTPANCVFMRIEINEATSFDNLIMQKGSTKSENIPNPLLTGIDVELNSDNLAIDVDNLAFVNDPVNKDVFLDKTIYLNTYINPTVGTPNNHATFASSEYIEVEPENTYRFSRLDGTTTGFGNVVFYDQDKNYIDGQYSGSPFTSPAGCHYVRVSVNDATTFDDVILQKGEEPSLPINDKITTAFKTDEGYFNKKWAVVGDSITEKNFRAKIHYHDYIRSELGLIVENMGVSGSGYKAREGENVAFYQRVSNIPTDVNFITIMGGVNDVLTSQPLGEVADSTADTVCGCINKTIDNIYVTHPLAQIGLITPVPGADYNPANTNNGLALLSEKIIEIAKLRGLPSLDLYHSSGLRPWNSVVNKALFSTTESPNGDGLHPNDEGHKFFYRKIMEFVKTL
ncbi:SGNH/GDSL hydrolase family protein [Enterococcus gallinarum]|uniref:SGNH/GDSL hydrolase family protein n=1 Tax=Enterococcus gallinarum TaxID=1353 RepID=UPI001F035142|nr:GDSL-type esterase/lipase family protein [Enterococcus gallinarum]